MSRRLKLSAEHGYTMAAVMLVMLATTILAGATFAAVGADIPFARESQDRKQAYAAAEAGIEYYLYQLTRDNDYWTNCDNVEDSGRRPAEPGQPQGPGRRRTWRKVAGSRGEVLDRAAAGQRRGRVRSRRAPRRRCSTRARARSASARPACRTASAARSSRRCAARASSTTSTSPTTRPRTPTASRRRRSRSTPATHCVKYRAAAQPGHVVPRQHEHHVPGLGRDPRAAAHQRRPADLRHA